ncbi:DUF4176 domain-containing protein [Enterococcus faecium]
MTEKQELLPLGSIVLLEEGLQKLVVVGRGIHRSSDWKRYLCRLYGCLISNGLESRNDYFL